ncbi:MAG TPA: tetratricopeptide repeat protein [Bryobacteraceae bacterium]|nr:tetratricopeptide repeat protein [Bryobacteraceae bacterium]
MATQGALRRPQLAGYVDELSGAELDIASLESRRQSDPVNLEKRVRLAYRLFHRASLTGNIAHFEAVGAAINETIDEFGPKEDICLLKANLDFRFHRLEEVRRDLRMCPLLSGRFEGRILLADLDFQEGRYETARLAFEQLIAENRTWDNLARLAHWKSKLGDIDEADQLYEEAEDDLTAKQMRSYAWLELQRGMLALTHGRYDAAWKHYRRADAAYPGHWHTDEHFAELMAAEGRFDEAAQLFQQVIARAPKPELQQALGELYVFSGRADEAEHCFDRALAAYLESVRRGGVHYFHHLADFYTDARDEPAEAVRWARMDLQMRSNFSTQAALAWALYRNGEVSEAVEYIGLALSSGVRDAQIFSTAAKLYHAAGNTTKSEDYAQAALQINPKHQHFHMHH